MDFVLAVETLLRWMQEKEARAEEGEPRDTGDDAGHTDGVAAGAEHSGTSTKVRELTD